jgi:preprotein translocase subunit SecF
MPSRTSVTWATVIVALLWPVAVKQITGDWPAPKIPMMETHGGTYLKFEMDPADQTAKGLTSANLRRQALEQTKETFLFRLRKFEPSLVAINPVGDTGISVSVPGTQALDDVLHLIVHPQVVTFRCERNCPPDGVGLDSTPGQCFHQRAQSECVPLSIPFLHHESINYPRTRAEKDVGNANASADEGGPGGSQSSRSASGYRIVLSLRNNDEVRDLPKYYGSIVAICLDQEIVTEATMHIQGLADDAEITGYPTEDSARNVAEILQAGPLPVSYNLTEQKQIGPTLSETSLKSAFTVLAVAFAAVTLLLLLAYSDHPHLVAVVLACQIVQVSAIYFLAWRGLIELSLLTVCALALLSGTSVDNLILIFEEYRRSLGRVGFTIRGNLAVAADAIQREKRIVVWATVFAFVTVGPLLFLGGQVQGLVKTIAFGSAIGIIITLTLVVGLLQTEWIVGGIKQMGRLGALFAFRGFDLFALNRFFLFVYCAALAMSFVGFLSRGIVLDVDLAGGTQIRLTSATGLDQDRLRAVANSFFGKQCSVLYLYAGLLHQGGPFTYDVLVPELNAGAPSSASESVSSRATPGGFLQAVRASLAPDVEIADINSLGASVTGVTRRAAVLASLAGVAILLVLLFSGYGGMIATAIVIALLCDTTITVGAICWFSVPLSLSILSALLSVAGYSVYDSVVVAGHVNRDHLEMVAERKRLQAELRRRDLAESDRLELTKRLRGLAFDAGMFKKSLSNLSRRLLLTVLATALGAVGIAVFCGEGLLRHFGIVMAAGAIFGMMSTVAIVARAMKSTEVETGSGEWRTATA